MLYMYKKNQQNISRNFLIRLQQSKYEFQK